MMTFTSVLAWICSYEYCIVSLKQNQTSTPCSIEFVEEVDDVVSVFRFMDGSSFYILDDDDEYVFVAPNKIPVRIVSLEDVVLRPVTRLHPFGGVALYAEDINHKNIQFALTDFYDEFERDMFKEFVEEYL